MIRFGTDGIRGRAGTHPITPEVGVAVGRAAARLADRPDPVVLIARDPRSSGAMLEAAVAAGAAGQGARVLLAGVLPTSGVSAFLAAHMAHTGVMLTASHNPDADNGFKVFGPGGRKLDDSQTAAVEAWLGQPGDSPRPGSVQEAREQARMAWLCALEHASPSTAGLAGRRIALDLANGAATAGLTWLRQRWSKVDWIFTGTRGAPNDGCGSENLAHLQRIVVEEGCHAGLAVDGDADRCRLVDATGAAVPGDAVAWLFASAQHLPSLAVTVMSNAGLEASLPGVEVIRTPVGDKHLLAALRQRPDLRVGAEESGHVVFSDGLPTGDGLLTGLRALSLGLRAGQSLAQALSGYQAWPRRITKVRVGSRPPLDSVQPLVELQARAQERMGPGSRVFLRYSGTEPVLRLLVEGADEAQVAEISQEATALAAEVLS